MFAHLGAETLVYTPSDGRAHLLQEEAALVFRACERGEPAPVEVAPETVEGVLSELASAGLVQWRRRAVLALGAGLVLSVTMPSPAAAASACSCVVNCTSNCDGTTQCCPATSDPTPAGGCTLFCGRAQVVDSVSCATDNFLTFGCFSDNGAGTPVQPNCADARAAAGFGNAYACCFNCG